ncbi:MAG: putative formate hydrogenlyase, membrane subunit [Parcubacteria group bacterium Greene0714_7]|nr:NADH-quinone oxidoreductase subunit H [Candidatus Paceibacterota bacterium]TSD05608.1 MAG: putative formate hydrogenlyase, membrane subunit [Parcubacteria group bacterium Greene0714_7]
MTYLLITFQALVVLLSAPLVVGMVRTLKARFQNRQGPSIFLPYVSMLSLLRKEMTITKHSSWVFRMVPFVVLGSAFFLALVVPSLFFGIVPSSLDNIFLFGAVVALGSVFLVLGGMDTGSTFGNMGSSREMTLATLVEPALYVSLATLALATGAWGMGGIVGHFTSLPWLVAVPPAIVTLIGLLFVLLAENARYPVDNPATHLELTMVHEAMILEYSGTYLAMLEYASAIKLTALLAVCMGILIPFGISAPPVTFFGLGIALIAFFGKLALGAFAIAFIESVIVKMRFYRMQEYMMLAFFIALLGLAVELIVLYH